MKCLPILLGLFLFPPSTWGNVPNTVIIHDTSGSQQTNRPVSISRPFIKGEIPQCVSASVNGTPVLTQTNVKNRWNDGSIKHAIVSFIIPSLPAGGSVTVALSNQASCNDTGGLTAAQMLDPAYNFQTQINLTNGTTKSVNARTMLNNGHWRYWLQGPILTAVIIEDRSTARTYDVDFGTATKNLHPIIEAWFYPQNHSVEVGATIENIWASSTASKSMADTTYSLSIISGSISPTTEYTNDSFNHIGRSRWHRRFWNGLIDPPGIRIDHNFSYLVETRAIPHYDATLNVTSTLNDEAISRYAAESSTLDGSDGDPNKLGNYTKQLNMAGGSPWIGLQKRWEVLWLYSMTNENWKLVLGNADLMGRMPIFYREADDLAGQGDYFDQPWTSATNLAGPPTKSGTGTVGTLGRPISINARPGLHFFRFDEFYQEASDKIFHNPVTNDGWTQQDSSHFTDGCYTAYLFSGRYYYLECLQMEAAYYIGSTTFGYNSNFARPGPIGLIHHTNLRGDAWAFKMITYAAFISPDNEPEQGYFIDKLKDNVTEWEGVQDLPITYTSKSQIWNYGRNVRINNSYWKLPNGRPSPLGQWSTGTSAFIQAPLINDGSLTHATSPWEENFVLVTLGMANQMQVADTSNLLKFMATKKFHLNLDTIGDTNTILSNFVEAYRNPTVETATGDWVQTWDAFVSHFDKTKIPYTHRNLAPFADHSYAFISLAADSFLTSYTVDGLNGQSAYNASKITTPLQELFKTDSPKWAITPFLNLQSPLDPTDLTPPTPPTNLKISIVEK